MSKEKIPKSRVDFKRFIDSNVVYMATAREKYVAGAAFEAGRRSALEEVLETGRASPRQLQQVGTGALYGEQQYCFEKGWREGRAILRAFIRELLNTENKHE